MKSLVQAIYGRGITACFLTIIKVEHPQVHVCARVSILGYGVFDWKQGNVIR